MADLLVDIVTSIAREYRLNEAELLARYTGKCRAKTKRGTRCVGRVVAHGCCRAHLDEFLQEDAERRRLELYRDKLKVAAVVADDAAKLLRDVPRPKFDLRVPTPEDARDAL